MKTKDVVYIALFSAITAALGLFPPINIPLLTVPITAQTLGAMLAGSVIGSKRGALSQALFLLLVAAGMPLLAGGGGGLNRLVGNSGGFLLSWPLAAFSIGWLFEKNWKTLNYFKAGFFIFLGGIVIVYAIGVFWVSVMVKISLQKALLGCMAFVPGDILKVIIATSIAMIIKKQHPLIGK